MVSSQTDFLCTLSITEGLKLRDGRQTQKQEIMLKKWHHFTTVVVLCVLVGNDPGRESLSFSFFSIVGYLALKRKMPICGGNPGMASWCECSCS